VHRSSRGRFRAEATQREKVRQGETVVEESFPVREAAEGPPEAVALTDDDDWVVRLEQSFNIFLTVSDQSVIDLGSDFKPVSTLNMWLFYVLLCASRRISSSRFLIFCTVTATTPGSSCSRPSPGCPISVRATEVLCHLFSVWGTDLALSI
jgi:hypothetical protein